jgi:hypothetical protein
MKPFDLGQRAASMRFGVTPATLHLRCGGRADKFKGLAATERHAMNAGEDFVAAE